jgi:hypothetical protein
VKKVLIILVTIVSLFAFAPSVGSSIQAQEQKTPTILKKYRKTYYSYYDGYKTSQGDRYHIKVVVSVKVGSRKLTYKTTSKVYYSGYLIDKESSKDVIIVSGKKNSKSYSGFNSKSYNKKRILFKKAQKGYKISLNSGDYSYSNNSFAKKMMLPLVLD